MSSPSINYRDAIQIFQNVQNESLYISQFLTPTKNKEEVASPQEVSKLAQIAINGLRLQIQERNGHPCKLQRDAKAVKNYLVRFKNCPEYQITTKKQDRKVDLENEIAQLNVIDDALNEKDLVTFSDGALTKIAQEKECHSNLEKYGIRSRETKIRLAKLVAKYQGSYQLAYCIQDFGIKDQKALIELATHLAQNNRLDSRFIKNSGIKDQSVLIDLAKMEANNTAFDGYDLKVFGIEDQSTLIELAKISVHKNGEKLSKYIHEYGIKDQAVLIEIAKIAAQQDEEAVSKHIQNYGIMDQTALIEIAKIAAQSSEGNVSVFIQNYGIKDQNALVEIAKLAAQHDGSCTSQYIKDYGITNQSDLIEIAKLSLQQNPSGTCYDIQKFGIKDQDALIDLAKTAVKLGGLYAYIANFGITDQDALIEIAKLQAKSGMIGSSIGKYGIKDQKILQELAMLNAQKDGDDTSLYIKNFGLDPNGEGLCEVFFKAYKNAPKCCLKRITKFSLANFKKVEKLTEDCNLQEVKDAFSVTGESTSIFPEGFSPIFKELNNKTPSQDDLLFLVYIGCRLLHEHPVLKDSKLWEPFSSIKIIKCGMSLSIWYSR